MSEPDDARECGHEPRTICSGCYRELEAEVERLKNGEIFTERQFRALEKAGWRLHEAFAARKEG